ncbi:group III truncated hemoglobin [Rhizobium oryziradicis]|uniref:Globin n=1 Tax=Rhizobium oryziradicis TaxID=1867956 RepID=A0A1Q8ZTF8_9HYPH|nr:truncated hemoglobin [Rhizobium oryziradicis]OLP45332.1 globin [Rhizobium oryziradicis]
MQENIVGRAAHRADIQARAVQDMAAMGVDGAFIDQLVDRFYGNIQKHPALGPVFEQKLAGVWDAHLAKMKSFWSAIAFKTGAYGGKPVQAHMSVSGMTPDLFVQWLALFSKTLDSIAPTPEAHAWFMASAERIARSLTLALFYNPAMDDPNLRKT